ncbi:MAG TPA: hypothetical protein VIY28_12650 [Pseudonocardiaceae bacterium]
MVVPMRADRTAVAARTELGQLCTVTVQRDPLGDHLLRYEGSESAAAELTPEVIELLTVALSVRGRSPIPARSPHGGACTLLVIGHQDGRASLYFHACTATSAALDTAARDKLRAALELMAVS